MEFLVPALLLKRLPFCQIETTNDCIPGETRSLNIVPFGPVQRDQTVLR